MNGARQGFADTPAAWSLTTQGGTSATAFSASTIAAVFEPTTFIAGTLLLVPLGLGAARRFCIQKGPTNPTSSSVARTGSFAVGRLSALVSVPDKAAFIAFPTPFAVGLSHFDYAGTRNPSLIRRGHSAVLARPPHQPPQRGEKVDGMFIYPNHRCLSTFCVVKAAQQPMSCR